MAPENNSDTGMAAPQDASGGVPPTPLTGVTPPEAAPSTTTPPQVITPSSPQPPSPIPPASPVAAVPTLPAPAATPVPPAQPAAPPLPAKPGFLKRLFGHKKLFIGLLIVLLFAGAVSGAYFYGKRHEKIIIQAPAPLPINLPPQTVVVTECKPGRGKQYIQPKDIPLGPVYDVVNNKVIAVEYNFKASDIFVNADKLSDTLIPFFKGNYKTENFTVTPGTLQPGQNQADTPVNVAIFVVGKDVVNQITCQGNS